MIGFKEKTPRYSTASPFQKAVSIINALYVAWTGRFSRCPLLRQYAFLQKVHEGEISFRGKHFRVHCLGTWLDVCSEYEFILRGYALIKELNNSGRCSMSISGTYLRVEIDGLKFTVDTYDELYILNEIFLEECYNLECTGPVKVVDIGMNVGICSLFLAAKPEVETVYAFEPVADTYRKALANLADNSVGSKVIPRNHAVGNSRREELWHFNPRQRGKAHADFPASADSLQTKVQVEDVYQALQAVVAARGDYALWLKLDCEGAEYEILPRMVECGLLHAFSVVMLEWHDPAKRHLLIGTLARQQYTIAATRETPQTGMLYAFRTTN